MTTRDGVRLDADLYRPSTRGPHPVLLMRQPYGRSIASTVVYSHPLWYARQGYIVVIQDVRGRGSSEGKFAPFETEAEDGRDTVDWAAQLPGSSGKVGMYGCSYQGTTQLLAASERPKALAAICPAVAAYDIYEDFAYEGGALRLAGTIGWALQLAVESARRANDVEAHQELVAAARALPLNDAVPAMPGVLEKYKHYTHYGSWLAHDEPGPFWERLSAKKPIDVPALHIGGWFDYLLTGTISAYGALAAHSSAPQRLVVGPWMHFPWGRKVGTTDFGPDAVNRIDLLQIRWFDHWLKGIDNGVTREPAVQLFEMGANTWRDSERWPAAENSQWLLGSNGRAAVDTRDGVLSTSSTSDGEDAIVHDPWRPVPSGADNDERGDVLTYTSEPLRHDLRLAGDMLLEVWCSSDRPSFDVSAVVSQVHGDGKISRITHGYRRVQRGAATDPLRIPLRPTCFRVAKGSSLRLSLAGASFPGMDVNPGTGARSREARLIDQVHTTLFVRHGPRTPSRLLLASAAPQ